MEKNIPYSLRSNSVKVKVLPWNSGGQRIESCKYDFLLLWISRKFPKGVGLNALGNFQREKG
jgi:hypothetical protein